MLSILAQLHFPVIGRSDAEALFEHAVKVGAARVAALHGNIDDRPIGILQIFLCPLQTHIINDINDRGYYNLHLTPGAMNQINTGE